MAAYYIDTNDFSTATSIWTNSNLTVKAADGFYQKDGVYRQMSGGELLPSTICPSCGVPCGGTISESGAQGIYYLNTELGTDTGAVIINFDPYGVPDGILSTYNSINYNGLSSPTYGWLQGTADLATYIGSTGADCGVVAGSPYILNEYEYDGTSFVSLGTTTSVSVVSGQMSLTASGPGTCVMVIPKVSVNPSLLSLSFIGPCSGTVFDVSVSCPAPLDSFDSSSVNVDSATACSDTIDQTYYVAYVNGTAGVLGLYDLVFSDVNGANKLSAGYYKTTDAGANDWFQVDSNGVIIAFGTCSTPPEEINVTSVGGYMEPCTGGSIDDYMGAVVVLDNPVDVDTNFSVVVSYVETGGTCGGFQLTETFSVDILTGDSISNFNACSQGTFFPDGAVICGACISSCDNPNVVIGAFECPL